MPNSNMDSLENIQKLFKHNSLLDILLEIERFIDNFHIYGYIGWFDGEVVGGPKVEKYWVRIILMFKELPDPMAGMALIKHGCKVRFKQGKNIEAIKIKTPNDYRGDGTRKPKMKEETAWFIEISIPRRFIDEVDFDDMTQFDNIEVEDVESAEDQNLEAEGFDTGDGELDGALDEL
jgi:hypothetical protein